MISQALAWAVARHAGQFRDGEAALPYACHPIEVAAQLRQIGGVTDEAEIAAAFLHDLIEETDTTLEEIKAEFGPEVAGLVDELTRTEPALEKIAGLTEQEIWQLRSDMLCAEISLMSASAQRIKLSDRLSNLQESERVRKRRKRLRYRQQTERILAIIPRKVNPPLWTAIRNLLDTAPVLND
jgi:(p)ppGpp synthase/HD superfamily hydrolase